MLVAAVKQQQQRKLLPRSFSTSFPYCNSFTTQSPPRVQVVVLKTVLRDHTAIPRNPIFLTSLAICSTSSAQPFENPHMICKSWNFQHLLLKSLRLVSSKKFHLFHFHKNKIENFSADREYARPRGPKSRLVKMVKFTKIPQLIDF